MVCILRTVSNACGCCVFFAVSKNTRRPFASACFITGYSASAFGNRAIRWTRYRGIENLGTFPGGDFSHGNVVSADGQVIVGSSDSSSGIHAYRFTDATQRRELVQSRRRASLLAAVRWVRRALRRRGLPGGGGFFLLGQR